MKVLRVVPALVLFAGLNLTSCKPKDADVKANVETALKANADYSPVTVSVNGGVATLTGTVKDEATKAAAEAAAKGSKGVTSVVNNISVTPAQAPVVVSNDDPLNTGVRDAVKDFSGVTYTVNNGEVVITGAKPADKVKIKQRVDALQPRKVTFN